MNRKKEKIDLFVIESVKKRRKELNLTQEQLADEVGFSNTFVKENLGLNVITFHI